MRKIFGTLLASLGLAVATPSAAATIISSNGASSNNGGIEYVGSDGVNVRVTGWAALGGQTIEQVTPGVFGGGLGIENSRESASGHAADNGGSLDFFILQFDQAVSLGDVTFNTGFQNSNDTDSTIGFALSNLPFGTDLNLAGQNLSALNFLTQYESTAGNPFSGDSTRNVNTAGNVGNVWLIAPSFINQDHQRDVYKLKSFSYTTTPVVPEPGTWLMMILGFGLIGGAMRQKKAGRAVAAA
ncbi:PEPxxWA-CTERM sorting domain-containing protein [Erythrobacter sp. W53]|uniref:PEPxxWA-CTERM sorting domain-containing protein n=1 Tax=Erythrobacteraceae TaxID=335929 RepID=UPI0036D31298